MKKSIFLISSILLLLSARFASAQHLDYTTDSGFDIGFGIGGSYQLSDVRNSRGGAFDFSFGHSIFQREDAFFSFDWRFRFLAGQNQAFDDRINPDSTYNNVQYSHLNMDLELVLTLNRLRDRTGIILSGFVGPGLAYNQTDFDRFDDFGFNTPYDYSVINAFGTDSPDVIYRDLKDLSDGNFETPGITTFCFTPTWGVYLGYQFTKHFSMGIQHKSNLFLTEDNTAMGADIDGLIKSSPIDNNNYTTLVFLWDIGRRTPHDHVVPCNSPDVNVRVNEVYNGYATHELTGFVTNVTYKAEISLTVDGISNYEFQYTTGTNSISAMLNLSPGTHTIIVSAGNACGNDSQTLTVYVNAPCNQPVISIGMNEVAMSFASHELRGTISNVTQKSDISIRIDGYDNYEFNFSPSTKKINSYYKFTPGTHTVVVSATNECGTVSETISVVVNSPCDLPLVDFSVNETNLSYATHELTGIVHNVNYKSEISIQIDGREDYEFNYSPATKRINAFYKLPPGNHSIVVRATTDCGTDSRSVTVFVGAPCDLPMINFSVYEVSTGYASHELSGTVTNVRYKTDITLLVDGIPNNGFQYVPSTKSINSKLNLSPGSHTIVVSANNDCGMNSQTFIVDVYAPCDLPVINFSVNERTLNYATHELTGTVYNVNYKSEITLKVDGITNNNFQFFPGTHSISANLNLSPGSHTVEVFANNACGNDSKTVSVYENAPCDLPVVDFSVNEAIVGNSTHELIGTVLNVKNKSELSLKIDGISNNAFQYIPNTRRINANLNLSPGTHTIVVTATNACGTDSKTVTVTVNAPCDPPVVDFSVYEASQGSFTHQLTGSVLNVKNKSEISMKVDGMTNNAFQFIPNTHALSANLNLTSGTHTIVVTATNACGTDSKTVTVTVNAPCDPPVVDFSVYEASQGSFTHQLTGTVLNVKNKSEISMKVDGMTNNAFQFIPNTHALNANLNLTSGTHTIVVTATNACGTDSKTVTVTVNAPCDPPVVDFSVYEAGQGSFTHQLSGTVLNVKNKSEIRMTVDGMTNNAFQFIPNTHALSANLNLTAGTHTIVVTATNACGTDSKTVTVTVNAPCDPPVVDFSVYEASQGSFTHQLSGTVLNVKNKSEISMKVDGITNNAFQFIPNTHALSANLNLTSGTHTIVVTATNACGTDSKTVTVTVNAPCDPPVVSFSVNEVTLNNATHQLIGTVTNVSNKSEISLKIDGITNNAFQFIPSTHAISANLNLAPGTHTIVVSATNSCGTDSKTVTVTVEAPCNPPVVSFSVNEVTLNNATHQLVGTVTNVSNKSEISLKIDGITNNAFQFIPSTHAISANLNLAPGTHTIVVSATNSCGTDSKTVTVTVEAPCNPPVVSFSVNEVTLNNATHQLVGTVTNVSNKSEISLKIDGITNNAFQFIPSTHAISANLNLAPGTHTIVVSATNACGTHSETKTVTVEEEGPCGPRINPGNADWEFCLVTPSRTYNRSDLSSTNFSYSGPATSLYFKAIAGGGNATVNGNPYTITPGNYYLFTGNLTVSVSTKNPGSMGHWSVCINASGTPQYGNGNSRPKSPCEETNNNGNNGGRNNGINNGGN